MMHREFVFFLLLLTALLFTTFTGRFIPFSLISIILFSISKSYIAEIDKKLFLVGLLLLVITLVNNVRLNYFFTKDVLKICDFLLLSVFAPTLSFRMPRRQLAWANTLYFLALIVWIMFYKKTMNVNAIFVPIFFIIFLNIGSKYYGIYSVVMSSIGGYIGSLSIFGAGLISIFCRQRFYSFAIIISVIFIYFSIIYLPQYLPSAASSLLVRLDMIVNILFVFSGSTSYLDIIIGRPDLFEVFTNGEVTTLSGYTYSGSDPHNIFAYIGAKFGVLGLLSFVLLFINTLRGSVIKVQFTALLILFAIFEPAFSHLFLGLLSLTRRLKVS